MSECASRSLPKRYGILYSPLLMTIVIYFCRLAPPVLHSEPIHVITFAHG